MRKAHVLLILSLCITLLTQQILANEAKDAHYGVSAEEIAKHPFPDLEKPLVNRSLLHDRSYYQVSGVMQVYDAPNGNVIRSVPEGFNFVTTINHVDGWAEINQGEWVATIQLTAINYGISQFTGVFLPEEPLPYTMAWMLVNVYPSKTPGGSPIESNGLMYRYTQVYLYDAVEVDGWEWYQIGIDQWVKQTQVAKFTPALRPEGVTTELWVGLDLYEQVITAYEGDTPIFTTLVSTGLPRWPTYEGVFNIHWRRIRKDMSWGKPGDDFYVLEEVPWTMFFDEGRAIHGAYWHDGFGYRRSHGCVNLSITDANWMYNWVADNMGSRASADLEEGPQVYVYSSGVYRD